MMENCFSKGVNATVTEADKKALARAHKHEERLIENGYRWYKVNGRFMILVPFGKDGKPTKKGQQMINNVKENWL